MSQQVNALTGSAVVPACSAAAAGDCGSVLEAFCIAPWMAAPNHLVHLASFCCRSDHLAGHPPAPMHALPMSARLG